jgi:hypothetical protein
MTRQGNRFFHVCVLMVVSVFGSGSACAAPDAKVITGNLYFQRAIQASMQLMTVLTVAIPVTGSDVTASINQANLGFAVAGWTLIGQSAIERDGTTTQILLTYRKSNS